MGYVCDLYLVVLLVVSSLAWLFCRIGGCLCAGGCVCMVVARVLGLCLCLGGWCVVVLFAFV